MDKSVRPPVTANCTQNGLKGATASDPYTFKGQRLRTPVMNQPPRQALHRPLHSCKSCDCQPVKSRAAMHQPYCAHALHGEGWGGQSLLQSVLALLGPAFISI